MYLLILFYNCRIIIYTGSSWATISTLIRNLVPTPISNYLQSVNVLLFGWCFGFEWILLSRVTPWLRVNNSNYPQVMFSPLYTAQRIRDAVQIASVLKTLNNLESKSQKMIIKAYYKHKRSLTFIIAVCGSIVLHFHRTIHELCACERTLNTLKSHFYLKNRAEITLSGDEKQQITSM